MEYEERLQKMKTGMKVAIICWAEMGHFIPCAHLGEEIVSRGHEVTFLTNGYGKEKCTKMVEAFGAKCIATDDSFEQKDLSPEAKDDYGWIQLKTEFQDILMDLKPDIVVCDFLTKGGVWAADQCKIQVVINFPGPVEAFTILGYPLPDSRKQVSCCGILFQMMNLKDWIIKKALGRIFNSIYFQSYMDSFTDRVVLFNTFWGFDHPLMLPPNFIITFPLFKQSSGLLEQFKQKDLELFQWLNKAQADQKQVVYISLGSMVQWQQWEVDAFYYGLKSIGVRAVWSLRDLQIPQTDDSDFWVKPWIPQVEVLAHPAVQCGMTHCGFGGTLEFIAAGKPIVAFPHFGDQPMNADMLIQRRVAVQLRNVKASLTAQAKTEKRPIFTKEDVAEKFKLILSDKSFSQNMKTLAACCNTTGGRKLAAEWVERAFVSSTEHLVDKNYAQKAKKINFCFALFFIIFLTAQFAVFLWLIIDKSERDYYLKV